MAPGEVALVVLSQPSSLRIDGVSSPATLTVPTLTGADRFLRLARVMNWPIARTAAGPAASVVLSPAAATVVEANLRTFRVPIPRALSVAETEVFCTLVSDGCPEFDVGLAAQDAFTAALALG